MKTLTRRAARLASALLLISVLPRPEPAGAATISGTLKIRPSQNPDDYELISTAKFAMSDADANRLLAEGVRVELAVCPPRPRASRRLEQRRRPRGAVPQSVGHRRPHHSARPAHQPLRPPPPRLPAGASNPHQRRERPRHRPPTPRPPRTRPRHNHPQPSIGIGTAAPPPSPRTPTSTRSTAASAATGTATNGRRGAGSPTPVPPGWRGGLGRVGRLAECR